MSEEVYLELREFLRRRAQRRCEYCLLHEDDAKLNHEPDHVIASKHRGRTVESNLAWACFGCNRHKGTDIGSIDIETGQLLRFFNPRIDSWSTHFRLEGAKIVPVTPEARVTEYVLQFNRRRRLQIRRRLIIAGRYPR